MPGNGGSPKNGRIPTWFTVVLALAGVIVGAGGGASGVMYKVSSDYATNHDVERLEKKMLQDLREIKTDAGADRKKLDETVTMLSHQVLALKDEVADLNAVLRELRVRLEHAERRDGQ